MAFTGMGTGNELEVVVGGDASGAMGALSNLRGSLIGTAGKVAALGAALGGALAVGGLAKATKAAADFETAMVEVEKVTDPQTAREMAGAVRELAREIPVAQEELAAIAADAARFGVRGSENITRFTETVSKMATATDLSTQEAGEAFARLATLTNTPVDEMENLGSAVNELSNNFATSAGEVVDSMLRSSAALTQFGLSNTQIVAMSASLNEVSESSERAGSRLRRLAQELMDPRKVADLAEALGMTEEEFRAIRRERPDELMMRIVEAFDEGGQTAEALRGTLSTTSRQAVAGLAQNLDGLRSALEQSNQSFKEGTSLQKEFDAATDTFNSRVQVLKNNLNDIAITVGNNLLPVLNPFLSTLNDLLSGGKELNEVLDDDTVNTLSDIGIGFQNLHGPVEDNVEEIFELAGNLWFFSKRVLPLVKPALKDLRFILQGTAAALEAINDSLEKGIQLWRQQPEWFKEGVRRGIGGGVRNPVLGVGSVPRGVRDLRRADEMAPGVNRQQEFVFRVEGDTEFSRWLERQMNNSLRREANAARRRGFGGSGPV